MNVVVRDVCEGGIRPSHSKGLFCDSLSVVVVGCGSGVLKWLDLWLVSFRGYE